MPGYVSTFSSSAIMNSPRGIVIDSANNLYVVDAGNHIIRKITPNGNVSTFAGSGTQGNNDGAGTSASFDNPNGITLDSLGNLYVTDTGNHIIRKITPNGVVSTLAGSGGIPGNANGLGTNARFDSPRGIAIDSNGNLYVGEMSKIRKITPNGVVSTFAGSGSYGNTNGLGENSSFSVIYGIAIDSEDNLYVSDAGNYIIRKITPNGDVTTLAGSGRDENNDGLGTSASFGITHDLTIDSEGNLYVADAGNHTIRKITPIGDVSTVAGSGLQGGSNGYGTNASFSAVYGVAIDSAGNLYVTDEGTHTIRKITLTSIPCFPTGTRILTIGGYKRVEELETTDRIVTPDNRQLAFKLYSRKTVGTKETAPYLIHKHAFGAEPKRDIRLSPLHAIQSRKNVWQIPKYAALRNSKIEQYGLGEEITYYHIELPNYFRDNIVADGSIVESFGGKQANGLTTVYKWSEMLEGFTRITGVKGASARK